MFFEELIILACFSKDYQAHKQGNCSNVQLYFRDSTSWNPSSSYWINSFTKNNYE